MHAGKAMNVCAWIIIWLWCVVHKHAVSPEVPAARTGWLTQPMPACSVGQARATQPLRWLAKCALTLQCLMFDACASLAADAYVLQTEGRQSRWCFSTLHAPSYVDYTPLAAR